MAGEKSIHTGHRKRVRAEFTARGLEGLPDHRVLELLLYYAIPRGDVNPLAHRLLEEFGSLSGVLGAGQEQLMAVRGVGENTAVLLRLVGAVSGRILGEGADLRMPLREEWQFRELLAPCFFGARSEMVWLLSLDGGDRLISCKKLAEGDAMSAQLPVRSVVSAALMGNAAAVVLAHNHVSGVTAHSEADRETTRYLHRLLGEVGVRLVDHYVSADGELVSLRRTGCFDGLD